jgi:hypothetical protein
VGPSGRTTASVPPAGTSRTLVLSYTGKRPVSAAVISAYGSVVVVHCGCEAGSATGTVSVRETFSLSGKPPRQAPLVRSTSNRPTRPWLTVVNRSTRGRYGRSARSTAPSAKSRQRTGNTAVSTRAGPSGVSITVPSRASATAPEGLEIRMSRSSVKGSNPVSSTRFSPFPCPPCPPRPSRGRRRSL